MNNIGVRFSVLMTEDIDRRNYIIHIHSYRAVFSRYLVIYRKLYKVINN